MQFFFLALLAPISAFAYVVSDPLLVRVLDGHAYNCRETYEEGKSEFLPVVTKAEGSSDLLTLKFQATFQLCYRQGSALQWKPWGPLDPIFTQDAQGYDRDRPARRRARARQ